MLKSKIRIRLAELNKPQTELAKELNVAKQTISGWATGRVKPPLVIAFKLAKLLDCKVDDLWELKE